MKTFAERFETLARERSPLCLGLDPSRDLLMEWGLGDDAESLRRFCGAVLDAAGDRVAVVKPQAAFFERLGPAGMAELASVTAAVRERGTLSLIDAKRGDFTETMKGYAQAMLGADSGFGGDAMTVTAYLGFDALRPVFVRAVTTKTAVFVVVRSSNPEGRALQGARLPDGRAVADALADDITAFNAAVGSGFGPLCAVMGATIDTAQAATLARMPRSLFLAPGVGAQGATCEDVAGAFGPAIGRTMPSVSRAILRQGPSSAALREAIDRWRDAAWRAAEGVVVEA
jgi:orotidine-5'-phosphate decarboxylase